MQTTVNITYQGVAMTVTGDYAPLVPARTNAHPEHCHEEEGGEFELSRIEIGGVDVAGLLYDAYYPAINDGKLALGTHLVSRITDLAYDAANNGG